MSGEPDRANRPAKAAAGEGEPALDARVEVECLAVARQ